MFHVVLIPVVILAVVVCCCVPLPVVASVVASGLLWWLFTTYRNTLGAMSGIELGRSGLLEGYGTLAPRLGLAAADLRGPYGSPGKTGLGGAGVSGPFSGDATSGRSSGAASSGQLSGAASSGQLSGAASSGQLSGAAESPRNSSRSGAFDEPFSPLSSPSVSVLSRSSYKENLSYRSDDRSGGSPMLPPGSYPWFVPSAGSAIKKRINLDFVPVKIKVSKPTSSFLPNPDVPEEEPLKTDSSKQIIQALKAMSRKRLHTTESDDSHEESFGAVPKRRPMDYHHNLYASHLGSDSSFQGIPEIREDGVVDNRTENGSEPNLNASSNVSSESVPNNGAINNAVPVSNKRPRAANDGGSQAAKKRNRTNNEILSSLSSSLALLDQNIINRRTEKRREGTTKVPVKRMKTLETHCVEVQTLPSPILKEDQTKNKEDKSTATDRIVDGSKASSHSTQNSGVTEKKVTDKMAAALLKSALLKFANSGELVTPDTSANSNSILSECSLSKNDVAEKGQGETQKSVRFTLPGETPKTTESVLINGSSSIPSLTSGTIVENVEQPSKPPPAFTFGSGSLQSTSASAVTSSPALVTASVAPIASPSLSAAAAASNADKPSGFTLANANSMAITPSPTDNSNLFSFGSSAAGPKAGPDANTASKTAEPPVSAPSAGFTFGDQSASQTPSFTFGAPSTQTSTPAPVLTSKKETTPAPVTSASLENKQSPFSFGQSTTSAPSQVQQSNIGSGFKLGGAATLPAVTSPSSAQPAVSKPGGFSFTPSAKFSFGSTAATSSVVTPTVASATTAASSASTTLAQPAQPAFSFGNSAFGAKAPESGSKGLFGMPPPPSKTASSAPEPPKLFGASGGFNFNPSSKDQQPGFPAQTPQKPEEKKQEGFVFGGFGQKPEAAKPFAFGGSASTGDQAKPSAPAFAFGASSAPQPAFAASSGTQPAFGSFSSKPVDPPTGSVFNPPATTASSLFGSTTTSAVASGRNSVASFGSAAPKTPLSFGTPATTVPSFGSSTLTATTTANPAPSFSSGLTSMASVAPAFGSAAPTFGSSAPTFGSSAMTFGSGAAGFGSTNPPTFGSVAGAPAVSTTNTPAPTFGSGATSVPQFGSSTFGSSSSVPAFGSTFGAASAFGAPQTTTQQAVPAFGAPHTTTQQTVPVFRAPQTTTQQTGPAFGAPQTTTQQAVPAFGAPQTTPQQPAPAFGTQQTTAQSSPFSFSASTQPAAPASSGFNFQALQASGASRPMFQFGATGAPAQPSAPQPFAFSGAPAPAPGIGGGFTNTMFSIGSGTAAPRNRTTLRTRKK